MMGERLFPTYLLIDFDFSTIWIYYSKTFKKELALQIVHNEMLLIHAFTYSSTQSVIQQTFTEHRLCQVSGQVMEVLRQTKYSFYVRGV